MPLIPRSGRRERLVLAEVASAAGKMSPVNLARKASLRGWGPLPGRYAELQADPERGWADSPSPEFPGQGPFGGGGSPIRAPGIWLPEPAHPPGRIAGSPREPTLAVPPT